MKYSSKYYKRCLIKYFSSNILFTSYKSICEITISNNDRRNALSHSIINQLSHKISEVEKSENRPKAIIISSEGRVFSSGHDLNELLNSNDKGIIIKDCCELIRKIRNSKILFLAEVQGLTTAAGFQLVEACDMIIASSKSSFSIPGLKIGLYASTPAVAIIENIPRKIAFDILLKGTIFSAYEAYKYNFINYVVNLDHLDNLIKEKEILREFTMKILENINYDNILEIKKTLYKD